MSKVKILALLLVALLLTSCSSAAVKTDIPIDGTLKATIAALGTEPQEKTEDGYILAASNENFSLYYEEKGLTVRIKNNRTGEVINSAATPDENSSATWKNFVNSGVVLEYFRGEAININKTNMYSGNPTTKVYLIKNGFGAEINFKSIGISLNVYVTLNEEGIRVQVPSSSIKETNEQFRLAAIYVLPFLGYTYLDEVEGYMLIPDGCGAVIELKNNNKKFSQPYKAKVYGGNYSVETNSYVVQKFDEEIATASDTAGVFAPVFGMVHTSSNNALLGIIESGKYNSEIYAYPNGVIMDYNWITARYVYREVYQYLTGQSTSINSSQKERETFDISVVYRFLGGEDADYVGLAKSYREYLTDNGVLSTKTDSEYSMRLDFFAGDREKALLGKKFVPMTTVDNIDKIIGELTKKGISKLSVALKGWQKGGIYGGMTGKASFEGSVGSLKDYQSLAKKYSNNAEFMLYGDFLNTYKKSGTKDYIYQYNGKVFSNETFLELHTNIYRFKADVVKANINSLNKALKKEKNIGIAFDGVTNEVYSYSAGEKMNMFSRQYAADIHSKALAEAGKSLSTAYFAPNDYLWDNTEKYYDYRIYGSDYKFVTGEVPFFAIVLNGSLPLYSEYVNFKADTTEYKLKLIESGIYPSFLLSYESPSELIYTDSAALFSCQYSEYREMIAEYDKAFTELTKLTKGSLISDHSTDGGVSVTTYENGTKVVVNYNRDDVEYNGKNVEGQSYIILSGEAE